MESINLLIYRFTLSSSSGGSFSRSFLLCFSLCSLIYRSFADASIFFSRSVRDRTDMVDETDSSVGAELLLLSSPVGRVWSHSLGIRRCCSSVTGSNANDEHCAISRLVYNNCLCNQLDWYPKFHYSYC